MRIDLKLICCNIFVIMLLCALVYGVGWMSDITTNHQKNINISAKYHIPDNDATKFLARGKNIILDYDNVIYLISKNDYEKCIVGEKITISYRIFYLPLMGNTTINKIVEVII